MQQTADGALITSIIAVVLGALGLIGGVVGYVQGAAALRRATLARQRATSAEEAALQAQAQAEQAARSVAEAAERIDALRVRSLGDVADLPTGPLILPTRREPAPVQVVAEPSADAPVFEPRVLEVQPAAEGRTSAAAAIVERRSTAPNPVVTAAAAEPDAAPAVPPSEPASSPSFRIEPAVQSATDLAPRPLAPAPSEPPVPASEPGQEPESRPAQEPEPAPIPEPTPDVATEPTPFQEPEPVPTPSHEQEQEQEQEPEPEPEPVTRASTGQVTAGGQAAPTMDWAEAIRTGAIPLPTVSRGTYAAPAKRPPKPVRFEIRHVGRQRYEAANVGGTTAESASVEGVGEDRHLVRPVDTRPAPIGPGAALAFSVLRVEGREVSVHLTWQEAGESRGIELPVR